MRCDVTVHVLHEEHVTLFSVIIQSLQSLLCCMLYFIHQRLMRSYILLLSLEKVRVYQTSEEAAAGAANDSFLRTLHSAGPI